MIKSFLSFLFRKPLTWIAQKISTSPDKKSIFSSLDNLLKAIESDQKNASILDFDLNAAQIIIFSDQHKGVRDFADDFRLAEPNYLAALQYYDSNQFTLVVLGDCEELWENTPTAVINKNRHLLEQELKFLEAKRYFRVFGNHDLEWKYTIQQNLYLKPVFGDGLNICEAVFLRTQSNGKKFCILLTHGHQGDLRSDGNAFSKWFVAAIWTPLQRYFEIYIDTISDHFELVDRHNIIFYEWSAAQKNLILVTGHTHKPVFASLDHIDKLSSQLQKAESTGNSDQVHILKSELEKRKKEYAGKKIIKAMAKPSYFNSGCCCFNDGDISGIEISEGFIRLIKWEKGDNHPVRKVLEEAPLEYVFEKLGG